MYTSLSGSDCYKQPVATANTIGEYIISIIKQHSAWTFHLHVTT